MMKIVCGKGSVVDAVLASALMFSSTPGSAAYKILATSMMLAVTAPGGDALKLQMIFNKSDTNEKENGTPAKEVQYRARVNRAREANQASGRGLTKLSNFALTKQDAETIDYTQLYPPSYDAVHKDKLKIGTDEGFIWANEDDMQQLPAKSELRSHSLLNANGAPDTAMEVDALNYATDIHHDDEQLQYLRACKITDLDLNEGKDVLWRPSREALKKLKHEQFLLLGEYRSFDDFKKKADNDQLSTLENIIKRRKEAISVGRRNDKKFIMCCWIYCFFALIIMVVAFVVGLKNAEAQAYN